MEFRELSDGAKNLDWKSRSCWKSREAFVLICIVFLIEQKSGKVRINVDILNESQKRIVQYSDDRGRVTNKEVQKLLKVKESRALKILRELVEMEALKKGRKI